MTDHPPRTPHSEPPAADPAAPVRDPFVRRVLTVLALTAFALVLGIIVVRGIGVLLAAFGGVLIGVVLNAGARFGERRTPLSYLWSLGVVVVLILVVLGGGGWLLAPQVAEQVGELGRLVPQIASDIEAFLEQYAWGQWLLGQVNGNGEGGGLAQGALAGGAGAFGALSDAFSYALVAIFVGLFAAANPAMYLDGIVGLAPIRQRETTREMLDQIGNTLRWWLVGQAASMLLIGVSTMLVLWLFGVPLALVIGLIVGLLGFIPYLGPIIGVFPVAAVAATQGAATLGYVMIGYVIVQMFEGYVAVPLIHERTVYLPPVFTVIVQILLGFVVGVMGVVLATPIAAVVLVLTRFYRRDFLGDSSVDVNARH